MGATRAADVSISDGRLYWTNGRTGALMQSDLRTSTVSSFDPRLGDDLQVRIIDRDEIFTVSNDDEIVVFNQRDGSFRTLVPAPPADSGTLLDRRLNVDARYLYFSRRAVGPQPGQGTGFFRLPREGAGPPELLGPPIPTESPLVLAGDFVYFHARVSGRRLALVRRSLRPGAATEVVTELPEPDLPTTFPPPEVLLRVSNGTVYYTDQASSGSIWSVPANGTAKPERRVSLGKVRAIDMLVERECLYWATSSEVRRFMLDGGDPTKSELVADYHYFHDYLLGGHSRLATDGHYLYWTDPDRNRIERVGRDRRPMPIAADRLANSKGGGNRQDVSVAALAVGDGWGCASYLAGPYDPWQPGIRWQCWSAGAIGSTPRRIDAHDVPWLDNLALRAGADRLCAAAYRTDPACWRWPEIVRHPPRRLPDGRSDGGALKLLQLGGTFTCSTYSHSWTCVGDDRFGQLAANGLPTRGGALGGFHGCSRADDEVSCWGRGDAGQLGFEPGESCRDGSRAVACSRSPRPLPFELPSHAELLAGDMFSCALSEGRLQCWGASRDGLFGSASACPAALRARWPTHSGHLAAANATCSPTPVDVPGLPSPIHQISVGPRGACAVTGEGGSSETHCAGAIPTPAFEVRDVSVSPGDRASACGIAGKDVVCWGDGYSPPGSPGLPIQITLDRSPLAGAAALDAPAPANRPWPAACNIHHGCEVGRPLPACPPGPAPERWADLEPKGSALAGRQIRVRGPLAISAFEPDLKPCPEGECCARTPLSLAIGGSYDELTLSSHAYSCVGDSSRRCCNPPPLGQTVVAEGVLFGSRTRWELMSATLCAPASRP